jgi:hypothetical protein
MVQNRATKLIEFVGGQRTTLNPVIESAPPLPSRPT